MTNPTPPAPTPAGQPIRPTVLADLTDDLLWPRLLRAPSLALRPTCMGIALFTALAVWLLGSAVSLWSDTPNAVGVILAGIGSAGSELLQAVISLDTKWITEWAAFYLIEAPGAFIREHWLGVIVLSVPIAAVWGIGGCAISRAAARDTTMRLSTPWPRALAFAVDRWWSTVVSLLGPLVFVAGIALAIAIAGWAFFSLPVLDVIGALAYPLMILGGLLGFAILIGYVLGSPMLIPAVACEGTDGIDGIQRALAYVLGKPLRLIAYLLILLVQGLIVFGILALIVLGGQSLIEAAATGLAGDRAAMIFGEGDAEGTAVAARAIIDLFNGLLGLLVIAFGVSYYFAGSTVLYLLMRQLNDGQSCEDLWVPGRIEGTSAINTQPADTQK